MKALVSGGNRGLGIEICRIILANSPGSHVFMGCRDLESGREIAKKLSNAAKNGGRAEAIRLDVSSEQSVCLLYTSPSPRDQRGSRMPSSA